MYHEIHLALWAYQEAHEGVSPENLSELLSFTRDSGLQMKTLGGSWTQLVYVANLRKDDPPHMPIIMDSPETTRKGLGLLGWYGGGSEWVSKERLEIFARQPWIRLEEEGTASTVVNDIKARVMVRFP
jgi:hypothetical protein